MSSALDSPKHRPSPDDRKLSPPAFLDLADSSARLGSNMSDLSARVELKRIEHERQKALHRHMFEQQMRALEQKQAQELLSIPVDPLTLQHVALSAPTTPPRITAQLYGESVLNDNEMSGLGRHDLYKSDARKSVTYAPSQSSDGQDEAQLVQPSVNRPIGAKSMPGSRRQSNGSVHNEELANMIEGLSMQDRPPSSALPQPPSFFRSKSIRPADSTLTPHYNAGLMLDEQLDQEMQNAMRHMPISDEDKYTTSRNESYPKLSTSSAALDLAPLSQTSPRTSFVSRGLENGAKSSEWPQFAGVSRIGDRRTVTNPAMGSSLGKMGGSASASVTPFLAQHSPNSSRRSSPPGLPESLSSTSGVSAARSVPATPHGPIPGMRQEIMAKVPGSALNPATSGASIGGQFMTPKADDAISASDLSATLQRLNNNNYESPLTFNSIHQGIEDPAQYGGNDHVYNLSASADNRFNTYGFESSNRPTNNPGSTALYQNSSRYGLGLGGTANNNRVASQDTKMNGLHGPKHKRGDADLNRFAGTRLEDLQGEIPQLCKDQHGCRYLQKKLEEGIPEHRDMIFRETFGHFAELMIDPFGNYLCQRLLEFSTDEQRTVICDSVAKDLVNISLNMHGTRAVQKMIDFLSGQRQADNRYDAQIHSIIRALSLHVVVLIKDLNGNHVIQKCLNKLAPEDNQFIYNAVAANCVEVATHRHGCCVLQRCIDHASDLQRVQLVNEITYNALTLVQDPYGNYVVQYILDLNDNRFSDAVIRQFTGNVCALSVQKFSSNVIEKCIRVAEHNTRKMLVEELLNRSRLEKLLRDSFGNYCVQTALDYAEPMQRALLVEGIRPILPLIRNTPYGKRIQSKLQREQMEANGNGHFGPYHSPAAMSILNNDHPELNHRGMGGAGRGRGVNHQSLHPTNHAHSHMNVNDIYSNQHALYSTAALHQQTPQIHTQPLHNGLLHHHMDPYMLPATNGHGQSVTNGSFNGVNSFTNGLSTHAAFGNGISVNDPYSRNAFPYGI
ncbi:ARM repeat-containing protein [Sistotremastrum niveocremeum HHB9708]|uniref:ARM repeat-containing protein n=1 Tax=Sistotremastrum niveocremeum HHB9708 TaxID=1314777 RepID=A0A164R7B7_9AGAM|nr:ARM repeat-containing protein [Sistotremastrum niveocremeum HHB9708]